MVFIIMNWLYKNNTNNTARFTIGEYNNITEKTLICVGINPSTATPNNLDHTLLKVKSIAINHNYVNWIMINVYPQRATNPNKLHIIFNKQFHSENMNEIQNLLLTFTNADILFAYGNLISKRLYLKNCLTDIMNLIKNSNFNGSLFCIKKTIKGNPIHPLYQKSDVNFMQY